MMHASYPVPLHPHTQRWRSWWPLLARCLIPALPAQLLSGLPHQDPPNPVGEGLAGVLRGLPNEVVVLRGEADVELGGVRALLLVFRHDLDCIPRRYPESTQKVRKKLA